MSKLMRGPWAGIATVTAVIVLMAAFVVLQRQSQEAAGGEICPEPPPASTDASEPSEPAQQLSAPQAEQSVSLALETQNEDHSGLPGSSAGVPKLVDLGTTHCRPCRMMIPIIEQLKEEYAGRLEVEFIDLTKNSAAAQQYRVRVIPLQVFLDPSGRELFRHEGYWSKEDILAKWKALGYDFISN